MKRQCTFVLFVSLLFILSIQFNAPAQTHIGPQSTPPEPPGYRTALWPVTFALKLPVQVFRYTSQGLIIAIDETNIISRYQDIFFNEAETIGVYPMPNISPSSGFGGGPVFFYDNFLSPGMDLKIATNFTATSQQEVELSLEKSRWMNDRLYTNFLVRYERDPDRDFYGIGFDSDKDDRTSFFLKTIHTEIDSGVNLVQTIHVGGKLGYMRTDSGTGENEAYPSIEEDFEKSEIPAFDETLSFLIPKLSLAHDSTMPAGRPLSGGREEFTVALYHELTDKKFRLIHYELRLSRYIQLFLGRVIAARVRVAMNSSMGGGYEVPFFLRNQLGGGDTLRGYSTGRFVDKDLALGTLEYRFPVWRHPMPNSTHQMDGRFFVDAGRVFDDIFDEFTFEDMKFSGGFGLRFSTEKNLVFRLEIAKSSEQLSVMFKQNTVF